MKTPTPKSAAGVLPLVGHYIGGQREPGSIEASSPAGVLDVINGDRVAQRCRAVMPTMK
jgi:hypothetical protein